MTLHIAVTEAAREDEVSPLDDAYGQARLAFSRPEAVLDIVNYRWSGSLELGYFVSSSVTVRGLGSYQHSHGGWRIPLDAGPPSSPTFPYHDQLARDRSLLAGLGASWAATGSVDVAALGYKLLWGRDTNAVNGLSVSCTWSFSPAQMVARRRGPRSLPEPE